MHRSGADVMFVIWPSGGSVTGLHGFNVTAEMAGRRIDKPAVFGRALSSLSQDGVTLASASPPVDVFAVMEHELSASDPGYAVVRATAQTSLALRCARQPATTTIDGASVPASWSNSVLTVQVPAGEHRIEVR